MKTNKDKIPDVSGLDTLGFHPEGGRMPDHETVWKLYERARGFNASIDLDATVRTNENFFIGKQWEGVVSNGLPTPVFNVLKRVCCFTVATISSDNIKVQATPLAATPNTGALVEPTRIINEELDALIERNKIPALMREFARNAAVDGDGCIYTWWDADAETGQAAKGCIRSEILENTRVHFGNPNDRRVQSQPYTIIERRDILSQTKADAKANGFESWDEIQADSDNTNPDSAKLTDDKVTRLLLLWKDKKTGHIWGYECTRQSGVRKAWDLGIRLYPLVWLNWDYIQDCYHGQAMITGLIPNQIFINKAWAMSQLSMMTTAYPKILFDQTRIKKWDNRIGSAIGVTGGDVSSAARVMDPAMISPQISQFIQLAVEQTEQSLGATSVALGDTRPDNTSAIIALQRAAATPSEITKQNLHQCIEDQNRIHLEFMAENYGKRFVDVATPPELRQAFEFAGQTAPAEVPMEFDFSTLKDMPMSIKLDVGASSYYSEIASINTLDNLLMQNKITIRVYAIDTVPTTDYNREGTSRFGALAELGDTTQELTLAKDRAFTFSIDAGNASEQFNVKQANACLKREIDEVIAPEIDAYRLNAWVTGRGLSEGKSILTNTDGKLTKTTIVPAIFTARASMSDKMVPRVGCTLFIPEMTFVEFKLADVVMAANGIAAENIRRGYKGTIDDMEVVTVPGSIFPAGYNFIIKHKSATVDPMKLKNYRVHKNPMGVDGDVVEGRYIYDSFVLDSKCNGVYASVIG